MKNFYNQAHSGSGKTNALINSMNEQNDIDKNTCSNTMDDVYENINHYNPIRKKKEIIVFDDMIADIINNKKFQAIIKELFIGCRKLIISLAFITHKTNYY